MSLLLLFWGGAFGAAPPVVQPETNTPGIVRHAEPARRVRLPDLVRGETEEEKQARRAAWGITPEAEKAEIRPEIAETNYHPSQPQPLSQAVLDDIAAKIAELTEQRAETAAKRARAKAEASLARHNARIAALTARIEAEQARQAVIAQQIEELDIAFVMAVLAEA